MASFKLKVGDADNAVNRVKKEVKNAGGSFHGDADSGKFKCKGVHGNYQRQSEKVFSVTITDKPLFVPNSLIESTIRDYFAA
jgi:hypothetical protein